MTLLDLDNGTASLEMSSGDLDGVLSRLARFGAVTIEDRATYELVKVGGEEFLYINEWDEPCLISTAAAGSRMLATISASGHGQRVASG